MKRTTRNGGVKLILLFIAILIGFVGAELLFVKYNGENVDVPSIPRQELVLGQGSDLRYTVLGDSTAVGQGANYADGIAVRSTVHLAQKSHAVRMNNYGVSGARMNDVLTRQIPQITERPDIVLISIGANDITHFSSVSAVRNDMSGAIQQLRRKNSSVVIIITGVPAMGSVSRFPQPLRYLAGLQTTRMNKMFTELSVQQQVTLAPIAEKTGATFAHNHQLFAQDNFHPNKAGYSLWVTVVNDTLDTIR